MLRGLLLVLKVALLTSAVGVTAAQQKAPEIGGAWTGTWGPYNPDPAAAQPKEGDAPKKNAYKLAQMKLDAKVEPVETGKWQATFEGDCGRPYKYTIKMLGRQAGDAVLFSGTVDLGEKDGGVYDWIGRANEKEFVGFYTSRGHVGSFRLTRPSAK